MRNGTERIVAAIFIVALVCVAFAAFNHWALFGLTACALLALGLALGLGSGARIWAAVLLGAYAALLGALLWLDRGGQLRLVLGFPAATAVLIYGIWPMPLAAGLLYALLFRSSVLPKDKLEKFLAEHGRRGKP